MRVQVLTAALVVAILFAVVGPAQAGDTLRLRLPGDTEAATLDLKARPGDLDLDPEAAHWGWGWRRPWGWGGWGWGWGGGWGWRGYYGGYWGGYRGFYGGAFVSPGFYYYSYPVYSYGFSFYAPCSMDGAVTIQRPSIPTMPRIIDGPAPVPAPSNNQPRPAPGTFEYDGGPKTPVPMPPLQPQEKSARYPTKPSIVTELPVSYRPAQATSADAPKGKWIYPAYGEAPRRAR